MSGQNQFSQCEVEKLIRIQEFFGKFVHIVWHFVQPKNHERRTFTLFTAIYKAYTGLVFWSRSLKSLKMSYKNVNFINIRPQKPSNSLTFEFVKTSEALLTSPHFWLSFNLPLNLVLSFLRLSLNRITFYILLYLPTIFEKYDLSKNQCKTWLKISLKVLNVGVWYLQTHFQRFRWKMVTWN